MPKPRKGTNLTLKEQGCVIDLIKGKKAGQAVKNNYDVHNRNSAETMAYNMIRKPRIQYAILDLMDKSGCSDIRLVERLKHMIFDAKKEVLDSDNNVVELTDNQTSIKALDMAMKIKGAYAPERHEVVSANLNIYQDLSDEELNRRLELIEAREALLAPGEGAAAGA